MRLLVASVLALAVPAYASAAVIVVPDDRPTIRDAVAHARAGDTIRIKPGTYAEGVVIAGHEKDGLTLEGVDGRPLLTPPSDSDGIRVRHTLRVTIRGLDIAGGRVAVHGLDVSRLVVTALNADGAVHGIRFRRCHDECEISRSTIRGTRRGPGILVRDSPGVTVTGNLVTQSAREGIYVARANELSMDDNIVEDSGADGIRVARCDAIDMIDSNVARANAGSGLHLNDGYAAGTCSACGLTDNTAERNRRYGYRIRRWARLATTEDLTQLGNEATGNRAADVHLNP